MTDQRHWFAQKRYGYGAGLPIAWQGWALLGGYMLAVIGGSLLLEDQPAILFALIVPLTIVLMVIAARTTRGGWRWRWGRRD